MARQYVGNGMPSSPEELAQFLSDPERAGALFGGQGREGVARFRDAYKAEMMADGTLAAEVAEQTQAALGEFLKRNPAPGAAAAALTAGPSARKAAMYNKAAPGAKAEGIFANAAEFFGAVSWRNARNPAAAAELGKLSEIQNSFGSEVPADGGFLIPETLRSEILMMSLESSCSGRARPLSR